MSGRGIVGGGVFRSELIEANARTSDPTNPRVGDWWIRSDVQPSVTGATTVGALRIQGSGGVLEVPFFDAAEESNLGADVYVGERFRFGDGTVGFIAETDQGGALGSPRLVAPDGTEYQAHDSLEYSAIPDSTDYQDQDFVIGAWDSLYEINGVITDPRNNAICDDTTMHPLSQWEVGGFNGSYSVTYGNYGSYAAENREGDGYYWITAESSSSGNESAWGASTEVPFDDISTIELRLSGDNAGKGGSGYEVGIEGQSFELIAGTATSDASKTYDVSAVSGTQELFIWANGYANFNAGTRVSVTEVALI